MAQKPSPETNSANGGALGCFLCSPPPDLVYRRDSGSIALCGLGPLVRSYSLVATRRHIRSCADAALEEPGFGTSLASVRTMLKDMYGSCLVTEHGRLPVCIDRMASDRHCYHAHFLLFPGAPSVAEAAASHFDSVVTADCLDAALGIARMCDEYFLLSPTPQQFIVMSKYKKIPRQFARLLVAAATGHPQNADWRRYPDRRHAVQMASELRRMSVVQEAP